MEGETKKERVDRGTKSYRFLKRCAPDAFLLLALHGIVQQNPRAEDAQFSLREYSSTTEERAVWILERVRKEESQDDAADDGEYAHDDKQPEPTSFTPNSTHVQNPIRQQFRRGLAKLVAEVEEHNSFRGLRARVPRRQRPQTARNKPRFSHAQEKTGGDEGAVAVLKGLEGADGAEEEELQGEPFSGADAVENHVGGDFEEHDA